MATNLAGTDHKGWTKKNLRGMESFILPSLNADLRTIDVEGVRRDVRHSVRQGFGAVYNVPIGLDVAQSRLFLETICNEARGKLVVGGTSVIASEKDAAAAFRHAEDNGVSEMLLPFDPRLQSEEEIYQYVKGVTSITNLGLVLYMAPTPAFRKFHPSGLPMKAIDRLLDLPTVVGVKLTQQISLITAFQVADMLRGRALLSAVNLEMSLLLASKYPLQWSGAWSIDSVQSPEKPYAVQFMKLVGEGRTAEAADVYWKMQPALDAFFRLQGPILAAGGHPWVHIKYYKWLTGGNGGLLPDSKLPPEQMPTLDARGRAACRETLRSAGIETVDLPDEAFVVGNAAYARGVRASNLASTPYYAA